MKFHLYLLQCTSVVIQRRNSASGLGSLDTFLNRLGDVLFVSVLSVVLMCLLCTPIADVFILIIINNIMKGVQWRPTSCTKDSTGLGLGAHHMGMARCAWWDKIGCSLRIPSSHTSLFAAPPPSSEHFGSLIWCSCESCRPSCHSCFQRKRRV